MFGLLAIFHGLRMD